MSSDVSQTIGQGPSFSGMGRATLAIAARIGGLFAAVVVVAVVFVIINPNFANPNLGVSVLRAMSSVAIMAIGLTLVIVVGEIDLSFGAMYGLAVNSFAAMWVVQGVPIYLAMPMTLV